jgi:hypothetical protein
MEGTQVQIARVLKSGVGFWQLVVRGSLSGRGWRTLDDRHRINRGQLIAVVFPIRFIYRGQYIYKPRYGCLLDWVQHCEGMRPMGELTEGMTGPL